MRAALIALMLTIATQAGAEEQKSKAYKPEDCEQISQTIDGLLVHAGQKWNVLEKQPENKEVALEISWSVDLAANYASIYTAFCEGISNSMQKHIFSITDSLAGLVGGG